MSVTQLEIWPGRSYPLGATLEAGGTNFSIFSEVAEQVDLCLFDIEGRERRVALPRLTAHCWHGFVPGVSAGQRYGFRVHGPYRPDQGLRCNPNKLLLDPYARAVDGTVEWGQPVYPYRQGDPAGDYARDDTDSAPYVPRSVVVDTTFDWGDDRPPRTRWHESVIYETHVKGFTKRLPDLALELAGTFAGLASDVAIEHLNRLGVTAVELMPAQQFVHDAELVGRGLRNYWGYMPIGFFAPHNEYSASGSDGHQVTEFKNMVKALHRAGLEVILDVAYNHTAEGNTLGPSLCFRGIDNLAYYRTDPNRPHDYVDYTGVGNTLNMRHPNVLQLVMDSLRYWAQEMHVDGFRFDLAPALARGLHDVDRLSAFFNVIQQDPVMNTVKLIAEPWDLGDGGYQVGNFPVLWSEWNGKYRDATRDFWRGAPVSLAELSRRMCGSPDLYSWDGRQPYNSINFVTCHDGFTLEDLVSYENKHNEANGLNNADGDGTNRSWNCGTEGPSDDQSIRTLRDRQKRNFLATLLLSNGVPMLLGGDDIGRTQHGNNNAFCQDNVVSWLDWSDGHQELFSFVAALIALRREHPALCRASWSRSSDGTPSGAGVTWLGPDGNSLDASSQDQAQAVAMVMDGRLARGIDDRGAEIVDDDLLLVFNPTASKIVFTLPQPAGAAWTTVIDTAGGWLQASRGPAGANFEVDGRSMQCLVSGRTRAAVPA